MILFSANNNSLCGEGNRTSRSDGLMYLRELVFRKPRISNSIANLSSRSQALEVERNQRKTSDFASDKFQIH